MMNRMNTLIRNEEGQGMTEYIIIVALIAIAAIAIITIFGQNIRALFAASADALAGETASETKKYGNQKGNMEQKRKGLDKFSNNTSAQSGD